MNGKKLWLKIQRWLFCFVALISVTACDFWFFISDKPAKISDFSNEYPEARSKWIMDKYNAYLKKSKTYNRSVFVFVDYQKLITERRFYIVDPKTNTALAYKVSHGYGSDLDEDGKINFVGDKMNSGQSSEGVFVVHARGSSDRFKQKLILCGLSSTNKKAKIRDILVHPAIRDNKDYLNQKKLSGGCFAVNISTSEEIMKAIGKRGTLIIASLTDKF